MERGTNSPKVQAEVIFVGCLYRTISQAETLREFRYIDSLRRNRTQIQSSQVSSLAIIRTETDLLNLANAQAMQ